jgi:hypothetical protein
VPDERSPGIADIDGNRPASACGDDKSLTASPNGRAGVLSKTHGGIAETIFACMTDRRRRIIRDFQVRCLSMYLCEGRNWVRHARMQRGDMTEFEVQVLTDLSVLKNQMTVLVGDGNSGRVATIE